MPGVVACQHAMGHYTRDKEVTKVTICQVYSCLNMPWITTQEKLVEEAKSATC